MFTAGAADRQLLTERVGSPLNYNTLTLRRLVQADPNNIELRKALVSSILSGEFAGLDAFGRKVCEWQAWPVPPALIMAIARQTWDEVRHAQLGIGLLESYGGRVGEYPDTMGTGLQPTGLEQQLTALGVDAADPIVMLSSVNVTLESFALTLFTGAAELGRRLGDRLMEHCYDFTAADELTHTDIGDWFIKRLCEGDARRERQALLIQAGVEGRRGMLSEEQAEEVRRFFEEEDRRAQEVLGNDGTGSSPA